MSKRWLGLFFIFILITGIGTAYALPDLIIDFSPKEVEIQHDETALFDVELTNNYNVHQNISIPTPRTDWNIYISDYFLQIPRTVSKNTTIAITPPPDVEAGEYGIYIEFNSETSPEVSTYKYFQVKVTDDGPGITPPPRREALVTESSEKGFLTETFTVTILNTGTMNISDKYSVSIESPDYFFFSALPLQTMSKKIDSIQEYTWYYELIPGEEDTITYKISYLPLLIAGILIVFAAFMLAFYYITRFTLKKEIVMKPTKKKDEHRTIKIRLNLKNNTYSDQKNVVLRDSVPSPLKVTENFGTLEPTIRKSKGHKVLTWKFDKLEPREERVVSYELKSSMEVIGKILIPQAVASQKVGKKLERIYSRISRKDK